VRLTLDVDNASIDHRLRARLAVGAGTEAVAGAAFGFEHRPPEAFNPDDYPAEQPVLTAPAHRYVAAGGGNRALALFAPGFFEYEWTPRRDLIFTLLRSVGELSKGDLATRPGHAGWPTATPGAQEQGSHRVELVLLAGDEELTQHPARLEQAWEDSFLPTEATFIRDFTSLRDDAPSAAIALEGEGLVCSAIKPPESGEGIILRCFNSTDQPVSGRWTMTAPIERAFAVRADETPIGPLAVIGDTTVDFEAPPRRIVTVRLEPRHSDPGESVAGEPGDHYR
jgi:alpha-mannosidase